jgi:hypothetical protein
MNQNKFLHARHSLDIYIKQNKWIYKKLGWLRLVTEGVVLRRTGLGITFVGQIWRKQKRTSYTYRSMDWCYDVPDPMHARWTNRSIWPHDLIFIYSILHAYMWRLRGQVELTWPPDAGSEWAPQNLSLPILSTCLLTRNLRCIHVQMYCTARTSSPPLLVKSFTLHLHPLSLYLSW